MVKRLSTSNLRYYMNCWIPIKKRTFWPLGQLKTLGTPMGYPSRVFIWVVININDQTVFLSILASQKRFNSFTNLPFTLLFRSSHQRCSVKKLFLKFRKFRRKTPVLESLFNNVGSLRLH